MKRKLIFIWFFVVFIGLVFGATATNTITIDISAACNSGNFSNIDLCNLCKSNNCYVTLKEKINVYKLTSLYITSLTYDGKIKQGFLDLNCCDTDFLTNNGYNSNNVNSYHKFNYYRWEDCAGIMSICDWSACTLHNNNCITPYDMQALSEFEYTQAAVYGRNTATSEDEIRIKFTYSFPHDEVFSLSTTAYLDYNVYLDDYSLPQRCYIYSSSSASNEPLNKNDLIMNVHKETSETLSESSSVSLYIQCTSQNIDTNHISQKCPSSCSYFGPINNGSIGVFDTVNIPINQNGIYYLTFDYNLYPNTTASNFNWCLCDYESVKDKLNIDSTIQNICSIEDPVSGKSVCRVFYYEDYDNSGNVDENYWFIFMPYYLPATINKIPYSISDKDHNLNFQIYEVYGGNRNGGLNLNTLKAWIKYDSVTYFDPGSQDRNDDADEVFGNNLPIIDYAKSSRQPGSTILNKSDIEVQAANTYLLISSNNISNYSFGVCGDGYCTGSETPNNCPHDCGYKVYFVPNLWGYMNVYSESSTCLNQSTLGSYWIIGNGNGVSAYVFNMFGWNVNDIRQCVKIVTKLDCTGSTGEVILVDTGKDPYMDSIENGEYYAINVDCYNKIIWYLSSAENYESSDGNLSGSGYTYVSSLQSPFQICDSSGKCIATVTENADKLPLYAANNKYIFFTKKDSINCKYTNSPVNPNDCNMYYPSKGCVLAQLTYEEPSGVDTSGSGSGGGGGGTTTGSVNVYCNGSYIYIENNTNNQITCNINGSSITVNSNSTINTHQSSGTVDCGSYLSPTTLNCINSITNIDIKINPNINNPKPTPPKEPSVVSSNISLKKIACPVISYPIIKNKDEWYIIPEISTNINLRSADINMYKIEGSFQIPYTPSQINDNNILVKDSGSYTIYIKYGNTLYYCSAYAKEYRDVSGVPENPIVYLTIAIVYITISYFALRNIKNRNKTN